jgi:hypothetical protein
VDIHQNQRVEREIQSPNGPFRFGWLALLCTIFWGVCCAVIDWAL